MNGIENRLFWHIDARNIIAVHMGYNNRNKSCVRTWTQKQGYETNPVASDPVDLID